MNFFKSTFFRNLMGIVAGLALVFIMFVTAFEIACYSDYGFYEKEYIKYDVNNKNSIVNMEMDELMRVTREMMSYLRGDRENLVIYATIDGVEKEMFHEIDKSHMADVRELFVRGLAQRRICVCILILSVLVLILTNGIKNGILGVCSCIQYCIGVLWAVLAAVIAMACVNFTAVFQAMHVILFDNDNWLLDPNISRLINILPEGFFVDMGIRIAIIFIFLNVIILSLCFWAKRGIIGKKSKKRESRFSGTGFPGIENK